MSGIKWKIALAATVIFCCAFVVAVVAMNLIDTSSAQKTRIISGSGCDYPPFNFRNEKGEISGYDIEVAQNAAMLVGDEIEIKCIVRDDLLSALASGEIDVIASGISITDDRKKTFDFSVPYATSFGYIITTKGSGLENRLMVNGKPDQNIWFRLNFGVLANSTHYQWAVENAPQANIVVFDNIENGYASLRYGQIAALFNDRLQGIEFMEREGNAGKYVFAGDEIVDAKTLGYGIGFAWRKNDPRREAYDQSIMKMLKTGRLGEISVKYFKEDLSKNLSR